MALTERQSAELVKVSNRFRPIVKAAYKGLSNSDQAIKAHCILCRNGVYAEVVECGKTTCALNRYRPWQIEPTASNDQL